MLVAELPSSPPFPAPKKDTLLCGSPKGEREKPRRFPAEPPRANYCLFIPQHHLHGPFSHINYTLSAELGPQPSKAHHDHRVRQQTIPQKRLFPARFLAGGGKDQQ